MGGTIAAKAGSPHNRTRLRRFAGETPELL
jgi:hypothetical protein